MRGRIIALTVVLVLSGTCVYGADCNGGGRYEDIGDGTVQDCRTGLIWLKEASCKATSGGIANPTGELTWYDAMKWVAGLESSLCGLTDGSDPGDWRLPTKTEWMAMVAYAKSRAYTYPALTNGAGTGKWTEGDIFTGMATDHVYWSSTSLAGSMSSAWLCAMWNGNMVIYDKSDDFVRVWPVRGGQSGTFGSLYIE